MTKPLEDDEPMPFGKHKGMLMKEVPAKYLHYLWTHGLEAQIETSNVAAYIATNIEALKLDYRDGIW